MSQSSSKPAACNPPMEGRQSLEGVIIDILYRIILFVLILWDSNVNEIKDSYATNQLPGSTVSKK